jgi:glutamate racemase
LQESLPDVPLNIAQYVDIQGRIDPELLVQTTRHMVSEGQFMQVRFERTADGPIGVYDPTLDDAPVYLDLRSGDDPRAAAHAIMRDDYSRPVDPTVDRTVVGRLFRVGDDEYLFYHRAHHLVLDGVAGKEYMTKTMEAYSAAVRGEALPAGGELDFALPHRADDEYRRSARWTRDRDYWQAQVGELPSPVTLAHHAGTPAAISHRVTGGVPHAVADLVHAAAEALNSSVPAIVAVASAAYIARATGAGDVTLSLPVAARTTAVLRKTPLPVSNVLPIRTSVGPQVTAAQALETTSAAMLDALRHQRFRFGDLGAGLYRFRGPMLNIMLFERDLTVGDASATFHVLTTGPIDDLAFNLYSAEGDDGGWALDVEANPNRYTYAEAAEHRRQVIAMIGEFASAVVERSAGVVDDLPFAVEPVGEVEPTKPGETLPRILAETVAKYGDRPALGDLTYAELYERALEISEGFVARGIGPGDTVAIAVGRGEEQVLLWWAVALSGATILLIDPALPLARREATLLAAEPVLVLDRRGAWWSRYGAPTSPLLDQRIGSAPQTGGPEQARRPDLRDVAYVVFTSGTTGKPKGVEATHGGLSELVRNLRRAYGAGSEQARIAAMASPAFDVAHLEILAAFACGGYLAPVPAERMHDVGSVLRESRITHLAGTPTVLSAIPAADLPATLIVGGETLTPAVARRLGELRQAQPAGEARPAGRRIINSYGPAEVTIWSTAAEVDPAADLPIPIGKELPGVTALVLDHRLRPLPDSVIGELYLAGPQVARGYLSDPELTCARFVPCPLAASERMYRTGDLVHREAGTGDLYFHGRNDEQLSVNGVRVEPGEIERVVVAVPGVVDAVATLVEINGSAAVGVALTVTEGTDRDRIGARVRRAAHESLPTAMWPGRVIVVDELPVAGTGKADRKAIRLLIERAPEAFSRHAAPESADEVAVAQAVADLLGIDEPSMTAGLYDHGLTSLLAMQFQAQLAASTGRLLSIRDILTSADLREVAAKLGSAPASALPGPPARPEYPPVSRIQRALITAQQIAPEGRANTIGLTITLPHLNTAALHTAMASLLGRHEVLRTVIRRLPSDPSDYWQQVLPVDEALEQIMFDGTVSERDILNPLGSVPFRVGLSGPQTVRIVAHHVLVDDTSMEILGADFRSAYAAAETGVEPYWDHEPVQYIDAVAELDRWLGSADDPGSAASRQLDYWMQQLDDLPERGLLPADIHLSQRRPGVGEASTRTLVLGASSADALVGAAARAGVTPFVVAHAAVAVALARLTAGDDVVVAAAFAARLGTAARAAGMFANPIALRSRLRPDQTVAEFIGETAIADRDALENGFVPFGEVANRVDPGRDPLDWPLTDVIFTFREEPFERSRSRATEELVPKAPAPSAETSPPPDALVPLRISVTLDRGFELRLQLIYRSDWFTFEAAQSILDMFRRSLDAVTADSGSGARLATLLPEPAPAAPAHLDLPRRTPTLNSMVERVIARYPDRIAAEEADLAGVRRSVTYRELGEAVAGTLARIAQTGRSQSLDRGVVAVVAGRGIDAVVGQLAAMRAGAAFLPVDPALPDDRVALIFDDAAPALALVTAESAHRVPAGVTSVEIAGPGEVSAAVPADRASADSPAYLIYTSGSTGRPKGVVVSHAGAVAMFSAQDARFGFRADDAWLATHTVAFDASLLEIYTPLASGGRVVLAGDALVADPYALWRTVIQRSVTRMMSAPSAFYPLADVACRMGDAGAMRTIMVGGEALLPTRLLEFTRAFGDRLELLNIWGTTETTIWTTSAQLDTTDPRNIIGTPIDGSRVLVLDPWLRPVPVGVWGEIYQDGPQVSLGYRGRPELSATAFVADPFEAPSSTGKKMYRTGDIGRWTRDGVLEYLGRRDTQVQLRGYRVELSEISSVLIGHADIADALVLVEDQDRLDGGRLVAFVIPAPGAERDAVVGTVAEYAAAQLPAHQVPHRVIVVDAWPRTASRKIDRRALSSREAAPEQHSVSDEDRTVLERLAGALGVPASELALDDRLVDLGTTSLTFMALAVDFADLLGREIPVRELTAAETVGGLLVAVRGAEPGEERARVEATHLTPQQYDIWQATRIAPESLMYHLPVRLRLPDETTAEHVRDALLDVARRHHALALTLPEEGGVPVPRLVLDSIDALADIRIAETATQEAVDRFVGEPFDLAERPGWRALILGSAEVILVAHHAVVDGWSTRLLVSDFDAALDARLTGRAPAWRFAAGVLGDAVTPEPAEHQTMAQYWHEVLRDAPTHLALPAPAVARADVGTRKAVSFELEVPAEVRARLAALAAGADASLFHVLHVAAAAVVSTFTAADDVVIAAPVSGRHDLNDLRTVGMFVQTLPLRSTGVLGMTVAAAIAESQSTLAGAEAHEQIGYRGIVEAVGVRTAKPPYLDVLLAVDAGLSDPGVPMRITAEPIRPDESRAPLEFSVSDFGYGGSIGVTLLVADGVVDADAGRQMLAAFGAALDGLSRAEVGDSRSVADVIELATPLRHDRSFLAVGSGSDGGVDPVAAIWERASSDPESPAILTAGRTLTYAQLAEAASELAGRLTASAIGAGDLVAIHAETTPETVIAMVAVMAAGAAYLPLDPEYPADYRHLRLIDADPAAVVGADLAVEIRPGATRRIDPSVDAPAYVIYTSGSTGTPKGVVVTRANLAAMLGAALPVIGARESDVWTWTHSAAFDFSVWEVFGALASGGTVIPVERAVAREPMQLAELVGTRGVTILSQTPSSFSRLTSQLVEVRWGEVLDGLRWVVFGGEAMESGALKQWAQAHPRVGLLNMYGITETTVHLTHGVVNVNDQRSIIGRPLDGVWLGVLDPAGREVPEGAVGELYVAGQQVSAGYLNARALTDQRFLPTRRGDGRTMYRTGDMARRLTGGRLEYLGRRDDQLQVRGHRVDLGEIKAAILTLPGVSDVRVLPLWAARGRAEALAAFVTGDGSTILEPDSLLERVRARLPAHLVPTRIQPVIAWPLTDNGKLDREALLASVGVSAPPTRELTPTESIVAAAMADVLGVGDRLGEIGPDTSFFDLDGNSLAAARLAVRLADDGIVISVADVFGFPTVAGLAERVAAHIGDAPLPALRAAASGIERVPLTPEQEDVWLRWRVDPDFTGFLAGGVLASGAGPDRLARAAADVVMNHDVLRTGFPVEAEGEGPFQRRWTDDELQPLLGALSSAVDSVDDVAEAVNALMVPIDLSHELPWRATIVRHNEQYLLLGVIHHIAVDAESVGLLREAFGRSLDGSATPGAAGSLGYRDYALWRRELLSARHSELRDYWSGVFAEPVAPLNLPEVNLRAWRHVSVRGDGPVFHRTMPVPASAVAALSELVVDQRTTDYTVVHAALASVLARQAGVSSLIIGTAHSGRVDPRLDGVVGLFARAVPLRSDVDLEAPFRDVVAHLTSSNIAAFEHADLPLGQIAAIADPGRRGAGSPLFDVILSAVDVVAGTTGETAGVLPLYGLDVVLHRSEHGLSVSMTAAASVIADRRLARLLESVIAVLVAGIADPDRPVVDHLIGDLSTGSRGETTGSRGEAAGSRGEITGLSNGLSARSRGRADLLALLANERIESPASTGPAITDPTDAAARIWSNARLDDVSNALARELIARGVGPGDVVALHLPRSADSVAATLAVAKTGAAFANIDPDDPVGRRRRYLARLRPAAVVTSALVPVPEQPGVDTDVLMIDPDAAASSNFDVDERIRPVDADDVAYLTFTSGTTGAPKLVEVTQAGLPGWAIPTAERLGLSASDRVLHTYSQGFDAHLMGLVPVRLAGAEIVVCPPEVLGGRDLERTIDKHGVTVLMTTPSVLRTLHPAAVPSLREVVVGGEALSAGLLQQWAPRVTLVNEYGPTEATVAVSSAALESTGPVTIGTPLPDVQALVLDAHRRPVPDETIGELYLAGPCLARGYRDDPETTAAVFVPHPAGGGALMYRTGDLVHRRADGALMIHGRIDEQLKVRGIRVETAEIDSALALVPGVTGSATTVRETPAGERILVSWVVGGHDDLTAHSVHDALAEHLPRAIMPTVIEIVRSLPIGRNGKVDLAALEAGSAGSLDSGQREPATASEKLVAGVFAEVLGVPVGSVHAATDFFASGGTSLSATLVAGRLTERSGSHVGLRNLLRGRTVSRLAELIDTGFDDDVVPLPRRDDTSGPLPLAYPQRRLWVHNRVDPASAAYNVPAVLRLRGDVDVPALVAAVDQLVQAHEVLRTYYPLGPDGPVQAPVSADAVPGLAVVPAADDAAALVERFVTGSFDLTSEPGFRVALFGATDGECYLAASMHHAAVDGWSVRILLNDLVRAYQGEAIVDRSRLTYGDFSRWQAETLGDPDDPSSRFARQLDYWRERLHGSPQPVAFPPASPVSVCEPVHAVADDQLYAAVRGLAAGQQSTVLHVVHAAVAAAIAHRSGQTDVVVGSPFHGRTSPSWEPVVGMFVNLLPVRVQISADSTPSMIIAQVRDATIEAIEHGDVPYDDVVRAVRPSETRGGDALTSVLLVNQAVLSGVHGRVALNRIDESGRPSSATAEALQAGDAGVGYDLEIVVAENGRLELTVIHAPRVSHEAARVIADDAMALLQSAVADPDAPFPVRGEGFADMGIVEQLADSLSESAVSASESYVAEVRRAFAEILRIDQHDVFEGSDFFELGGTSLSATQVASLISDRFLVDLPARVLFERPTVRTLADALASLEAGLADAPASREARGAVPAVPVVRASVDDELDLPLLVSQRQLWTAALLPEETGVYAVPAVVPVPPGADVAVVAGAVALLVRRHPALRTRFPQGSGGPRQVIEPDWTPEIEWLSGQAGWNVVTQMITTPFEIQERPPLRIAVVADGDMRMMVLVAHHIVLDGESVSIIGRELGVLLGGGALKDPAISYSRAVAELNDRTERDRQAGLAFWAAELDGYEGDLRLGSGGATETSATAIREVDGLLADTISQVARRHQATEFTVVHTAVALALATHCGSDDIALAVPVSLRRTHELRDVVGMLTGVAVLRSRIVGNATLDDWVSHTRDHERDAFDHAAVSLGEMVDATRIPRKSGRNPLVQVTLSLIDGQLGDLASGWGTGADAAPNEADLQITVSRNETGWTLVVGAAHRSMTRAETEVLADRILAAMKQVSDGERPISRCSLLTVEEDAFIERYRIPQPELRPRSTLSGVLSSAVQRRPDHPAMYDDGRHLSYRELDGWVCETARAFRARGIGPGQVVAALIPCSAQSVIAFWASARIGAVPMPLDPATPAARVARVVALSRAAVVEPDDIPPCPAGPVASEPDPVVDAGDLAYVITTSGSTGDPNVVGVTHRGICAAADSCALSPSDRVAAVSSPSFDASLLEMLTAFRSAATLVTVPSTVLPGRDLQDYLAEAGATFIIATPSLISTLDPAGIPTLRRVVFGGEALPAEEAARWSGCAVVEQQYGLTETTIVATGRVLDDGDTANTGLPIRGVGVLVCDAAGRPVPPGVEGELYIVGDTVAAGYLGDPELTARRFGREVTGARYYRTGDLVRWIVDSVDGSLVARGLRYLGRADGQVKIAGHRVEPGEVDVVLLRHGARRAVTVVRPGPYGDVLVSYVVGGPGIDSLSEACRSVLPPAMVPRMIVELDALPMTVSGKTDRRALPQPEWPTRDSVGDSVVDELCALVVEVAGLDGVVDPHDDFFAVGGDSLGLLRLREAVNARFDVDLTVAHVFAERTPVGLSGLVESAQAGAVAVSALDALGRQVVELSAPAEADSPILWCVHPVSGFATDYGALAENLPGYRVIGLQLPGLVDVAAPVASSLEELAAAHVEAILSVQGSGPYRLAGWSLGGLLAAEMARRMTASGETVAFLGMLDPRCPSEVFADSAPAFGVDDQLRAAVEGVAPELVENYEARVAAVVDGVHGFVVPTVEASMTVYVAASDNPVEEPWADIVDGTLVSVRVGYRHAEFGSAEAMAEIARVLKEEL